MTAQPNPIQTLAQDLAETQQALGREIIAGRRAAMRAAELAARLAAADREIERLRAEAVEHKEANARLVAEAIAEKCAAAAPPPRPAGLDGADVDAVLGAGRRTRPSPQPSARL